jgi:cupin fold WbuC family metalloprotein
MNIADLQPIPSKSPSKSISFRYTGGDKMVNYSKVEILTRLAKNYPEKNVRICFHREDSSPLHIMLILERRGLFYPPHVHQNRDELHYVYEGVLEIHKLDNIGNSIESSTNEAESSTFSSISSGTPHLTIPRTEIVVYLEVKNGPSTNFTNEVFSPALLNKLGEERYLKLLSNGIDN